MASLDRLTGRRVLAGALGLVVGVAVLAGAYSFVFGFGPPGPGACACSPPAPAFGFETNASGGTTVVTVTHEGGDGLPAEELFVVVDGESRPWPTNGTASGDRDGESAVVAGDRFRLTGVEAGATVSVVWRSADSDATAQLAAYEVP